MISEKSDSTQEITRSNDGLKWSEDETMDNTDDDEDVENDHEYDDNSHRYNDDNTNETALKIVKVINFKTKTKINRNSYL